MPNTEPRIKKGLELTLGKKVRFFRIRKCLSQMGLELKCSMGIGSLSRIELNKAVPTRKTLLEIAKVLELDKKETAYLLGVNFYEVDSKNETEDC